MNENQDQMLQELISEPPARIVSLVPSMTESLFDLGLGEKVVGITEYCVHPAQKLQGIRRIGGPKNPDLEAIIALRPDAVFANQEENTPQAVRALQAAGLRVWVTFPHSAQEALDVLWALAKIYPSSQITPPLRVLEMTLDWAQDASSVRLPLRYFCPIWQDERPDGLKWWMTFNRHTYAHDVLRLAGGDNVFAERERRYPLEADLGLAQPQAPGSSDRRYPRLTLEEIIAADPEIVLLPSEPFPFDEAECQSLVETLAGTRAARDERIYLLDGSLITWHGTRLARALQELPVFFN